MTLSRRADDLRGKVKFIFQPAEEGDGGGRVMCEQGALDDPPVDAAFALHAWWSGRTAGVQLRLGPEGVWFGQWGVTVPWSEIAEWATMRA